MLGAPIPAQTEEDQLSLEVVSATLVDDRGLYASMLRSSQLQTGLRVVVRATNNSNQTIMDLTLWESACSPQAAGGEIVSVCARLHRVSLTDSYDNDLVGGTVEPNVVLYPGEQAIIEIHGRRPASEDGSFTVTIGGVSVSGNADH
jgi:hypothetical protein